MTVQHTTSDKPAGNDIECYRTNYLSEQEGVYLYSKLAEVESDAHLTELYWRLAAIEQRHANLWKDYLYATIQPRHYGSKFSTCGFVDFVVRVEQEVLDVRYPCEDPS